MLRFGSKISKICYTKFIILISLTVLERNYIAEILCVRVFELLDIFYKYVYNIKFILHRLAKNLQTRKGSRRGNAANRLELLVLVLLHHVP